jgi:hypothetical protein
MPYVRSTNGTSTILVSADLYNREGQNQGRACERCGAIWTCRRDGQGDNIAFHVWKNHAPQDGSILDWNGKNVAVECCQP